jgi:ABC-2 type transport system permease protein
VSPIALIARSEYVRRVRSPWFVVTTLLAPVFMLATVVVPIAVLSGSDEAAAPRVAVVDREGGLAGALVAALPEGTQATVSRAPLDTLRARLLADRLDGVVVLPRGVVEGTAGAAVYATGGLGEQAALRDAARETVRRARLRHAGATDAVLAAIDAPVSVSLVTVAAAGDVGGGALAQFGLANVLSLLIYVAILIYGAMVMRGVIEEKANRIVEVIASSVRPFDLMMGKVLGIGAVGLTQLVGWGLGLVALSLAAAPLVALLAGPAVVPPPGAAAGADLPFDPAALPALVTPGLMAAFVLFFLGGYLLFAGLFAAVGSMVDQEADAQSLQAPIVLPIMFPLLFLTYVADQPDAPLSVFLSLFPVSSPVLMVVRMTVTDVPLWEVALSLGLLVLGFIGVIWLASRVYRVGILMTGKKATFRDLWRWMRTA